MDKELLFEDTKFIESQKKEAQKKVFAINTTLDSLLEKLGCVLSNEEVENFMRYPDGLFEIVCRNLIKPDDIRVEVIKETISERLAPIMERWKLLTLGFLGYSYVIVKGGRATFNEEEFEKAMDAHRLLLDSEPRQKAWEMAQKIVSDIDKLEAYLAKNQLGQVQPHAIGNNTMFCHDCLIEYSGYKGRVKLEPQAVSCIK